MTGDDVGGKVFHSHRILARILAGGQQPDTGITNRDAKIELARLITTEAATCRQGISFRDGIAQSYLSYVAIFHHFEGLAVLAR